MSGSFKDDHEGWANTRARGQVYKAGIVTNVEKIVTYWDRRDQLTLADAQEMVVLLDDLNKRCANIALFAIQYRDLKEKLAHVIHKSLPRIEPPLDDGRNDEANACQAQTHELRLLAVLERVTNERDDLRERNIQLAADAESIRAENFAAREALAKIRDAWNTITRSAIYKVANNALSLRGGGGGG